MLHIHYFSSQDVGQPIRIAVGIDDRNLDSVEMDKLIYLAGEFLEHMWRTERADNRSPDSGMHIPFKDQTIPSIAGK